MEEVFGADVDIPELSTDAAAASTEQPSFSFVDPPFGPGVEASAPDVVGVQDMSTIPEAQEPIAYIRPSIEDILEHERRLQYIEVVKQVFPKVKTRVPSDYELQKMSIEELDLLGKHLKYIGGASTGIETIKSYGLSAIGLLEKVGPLVGIKSEGLTFACKESPDFAQALNELALKYNVFQALEPEYKMAIAVVTILTNVHTANKAREEADKYRKNPSVASDNLKKLVDDL